MIANNIQTVCYRSGSRCVCHDVSNTLFTCTLCALRVYVFSYLFNAKITVTILFIYCWNHTFINRFLFLTHVFIHYLNCISGWDYRSLFLYAESVSTYVDTEIYQSCVDLFCVCFVFLLIFILAGKFVWLPHGLIVS